MSTYTFTGFRYSCLAENEEFYHSQTCRYVQTAAKYLPEDERICGLPGAQIENGQVIPACPKHKELYDIMKKTFAEIRQDKLKYEELLKPRMLTRSIGVDLFNSPDYC
jgi:hypothetical protein